MCTACRLLLGCDMGGACGTNGGEEKCVLRSAEETRRKETCGRPWE
jgi:hypothetical protein